MPNNIDYMLQAAVRSLENTISPSINKENPLAREQVDMIAKLLEVLRKWVPYVQQRDQFELKIYADMVEELRDDIEFLLNEQSEHVQELMEKVTELLKTTSPEPTVLGEITEELRSLLSELVRASHDIDEQQRRRIESVIILRSKPLLDLHRAWFAPTGLVPDADLIPNFATQLSMK